MCFTVDGTQRDYWRKKTVVYKCVNLINGYVVSWWNPRFWYGPGEVKAGAGKSGFCGMSGSRSHGGIYVYPTTKEAHDGSNFATVTLKLVVDPKDLIGAGHDLRYRRVATYKKVIVPWDQPFIEWY